MSSTVFGKNNRDMRIGIRPVEHEVLDMVDEWDGEVVQSGEDYGVMAALEEIERSMKVGQNWEARQKHYIKAAALLIATALLEKRQLAGRQVQS